MNNVDLRSSGVILLILGVKVDTYPKRYGSKSTAHRRLQTWQQNNVWQKILSSTIKSAHKSGKLNLQKISVDGLDPSRMRTLTHVHFSDSIGGSFPW